MKFWVFLLYDDGIEKEIDMNTKPAYVILKADPNPDYEFPDPRATVKTVKVRLPVSSFEKASEVCKNFIEKFDLGSGNWTGGQIGNNEGLIIAHVSYNGRVWEGEKYVEGAKEIK
jgi:hypothetical protein